MEDEAVVPVRGVWLVGEAGFVEGATQEIAGAVAGEDAAGAVGSMRAGGEAEDEEAGGGVAEAGDGEAPVGFRLVGAAFDDGDIRAVFAEAGALIAGNDFSGEGAESHES